MARVTSTDGTSLWYATAGTGPPLILVGGGLDDGAENAPLMPLLADRSTVYNYARRGRGRSEDTLPYAVAREIEDLGALISVAGRAVHLFGASSGGALALHAAAAGLPVERVAVYEVPYMTSSSMVTAFQAYGRELAVLLKSGQHGAAVELFMRLAGAPDADIAAARQAPVWPGLERLAPTLAYDAACLGDGGVPVRMLARVKAPVLVATGALFEEAADMAVDALPDATRLVITGQGHVADPAFLAPLLADFFLR
ncbi:alpha/beta hydrolase [Actinoplanes sp. TBRC 11911]|uniref:alpha/beta fold hydrolase n=1 Tax=Actinoplanes sp. TBRC 11911 TaxID=2729386 RepID=UPI00145E6E2D|nr:alpha/beta hydrolase [Actinoplanes sp. TBRC 11911]NMO54821.1 alpha/beta hydrolase [Actinoplanes sp. TBRC 11911]